MPNWCSNNVTFSGPDVKKFRDDLAKWWKQEDEIIKYNAGSSDWLGRFLHNSGMVPYEVKKAIGHDGKEIYDVELKFEPGKEISCRAFLSETEIPEIDGECFTLNYESACSPMINIWQELANFKGYNIEITFIAEERGCGIYLSNDDYYVGKYNVDVNIPGDGFIDEYSEDEIKMFLKNVLYTEEDDLNKLLEMADNFNENDMDYFININQYEYADLCDVS